VSSTKRVRRRPLDAFKQSFVLGGTTKNTSVNFALSLSTRADLLQSEARPEIEFQRRHRDCGTRQHGVED